MKKHIYPFIAAMIVPTSAFAQESCRSFDTGQYPIGHVLTVQQRQTLLSQGPQASERGAQQCSLDGRSCTTQANDGAFYSWNEDGIIRSKSFIFYDRASLPQSLSGWKTNLDPALAEQVSRAACVRFTVETSDSGLSDNDLYLKSENQTTATGRSYVTTIFGAATEDEPLFVEMSLNP